MKNAGKLAIVMGAIMIAPVVNSQGLLNMFKKKDNNNNSGNNNNSNVKTPVMANPYAKDFSDDLGIGGTYFALDTVWINESGGAWLKDSYTKKKVDDKGNPYFVTTLKLSYQREIDDNVVNLLWPYYSEFSTSPSKNGPRLDEKTQKLGLTLFSMYPSANQRYTFMQIDKDVIAYIFSNDDFGNTQVLNVYAKDKSMLETYDKETALAKMQQLLNKSKEGEYAKIKEDLMKNETYAKMKGKVGFVTHYNQTGASYGKISEKPDVFISSVEIGKPFYWRAFYDIVPSSKCGDGCNRNMIFEIEGQKVSYMELRKKSSTWSNKLSKMSVDNDFFSMCPTMVESKYISNWAFVYCLYLNKSKFADGKSLKCKVTITNYRDGVDQDVLAEGTINLVYKTANKGVIDEMMLKVEELDK